MEGRRGVVEEDEAGPPRLPEPLSEAVVQQAIARAAPEDSVKVAVIQFARRELVGHVDEAEIFGGPILLKSSDEGPDVAIVAATIAPRVDGQHASGG